uniref:hypothetical protein n=1 Tax=Parerythrobacter lutipelagi TaxID=1964208 RepID=UPI0010F72F25|nr:hypothetical protein [Parerythrobacter lutipelagi]
MRLTAERCRAEQARQLELSVSDPLVNRRKIAAKAAEAWGKEAARAEKHEAGVPEALSKEDTEIADEFASEALAQKGSHAD